jgi:hypothetical protein
MRIHRTKLRHHQVPFLDSNRYVHGVGTFSSRFLRKTIMSRVESPSRYQNDVVKSDKNILFFTKWYIETFLKYLRNKTRVVEQTGFRIYEFRLFPLFHTVRIRGGATENENPKPNSKKFLAKS